MNEPNPEQLRILAQQIDDLRQTQVTRAEFDELKSLVKRLVDKVEQIAPANHISDEHLAIMSAVFAATIGKRFKIKKVRELAEPSGWTQAGRVNLHAQRHVRRS